MDTTVADPLVGQMLDGRYRVESRIARGGMATVYVARDIKLDRVIALKVMHAGLAQDDAFVQRFIDEAKSAAALSHPNVVAVFDQGTDGQHVFLAMEYVAGHTLRDLLEQRGRLGPREALQIMQPVLAALGAAHRAGLVHRDVKPENVLLTEDGIVKVADFGLARAETASKQTKTGMIIGTVGYLAPEQVLSGQADVRSDVYAAGIMLFELLTGRQPYQAETPLAVAYKHVNDVVPPPSSLVPGLPQQIDTLVITATSRDAGRRPSDANALLALVTEVNDALPPDIDERVGGAAGVPTGATAVFQQPPAFPQAPPFARQPQAAGSHTRVLGPGALPPMGARPTQAAGPRRGAMERLVDAVTGRYVLIAIGAVAALILGWAVWYQTSGQYQHVPSNIVGMKVADAQSALSRNGINVERRPSVYDSKIKKGLVVKVEPGPGQRVAQGDTVYITPSKGLTPIEVPDVRGKSYSDAQAELEDAGFTIGQVRKESSQSVPKNQVIRTDPKNGAEQSPDEPVDVTVSTGMSVPDLIGDNADEAKLRLEGMGLRVTVQKEDDETKERNTVLRQDPAPGTGVSNGDEVTIVVNKKDCGPLGFLTNCNENDGGAGENATLPVPNVFGKDVNEARRILREAGFDVEVERQFGNGNRRVIRQDPGSNTSAQRGSTVTIFI